MSPTCPHSRVYIYFPPHACQIKQNLERTEQPESEVAKVLPTPPHAAAPPSQHLITMAEWCPAAPGLSHLLPHCFFRDSVRKFRRYLLLSLLHWPRGARIGGPLPVHLLTKHRPTPRKSGRYFPPETTVPEMPQSLVPASPNGKAPKNKEAGPTQN